MREPYIKRQKGSPFWYGVVWVWSAEHQKWIKRPESTKHTDPKKAMEYTTELHRFAQDAYAAVRLGTTISRDHVLTALNNILRVAGLPTVIDAPKWSEYSEAWLALKKRPLKPGEEDRTHEAYRSHVKTFNSWLGPRTKWHMSKMDGMLMQKFYDVLLNTGRTPNTAKNIIKTVAMVFERAKNEGYTTVNPVDLVQREHGGDDQREKEVFSPADIVSLEKWLKAHRDDDLNRDWLTMFYLGLCTGRRLEDCANAQWQHFTTEDKMLIWTLRPRKLRRKNRVEKIPVIEPLLSHLKEARKGAKELWLCPSLAGRKKLSDQWGEIMDAAKIPYRVIEALGDAGKGGRSKGFHAFRHTLTSRLANAGVDARLSKRIVGHESDKVHEGYTHVELATMKQEMLKAFAIKKA